MQLPCSEVVVGAGWSGVYFAYRRALAARDPSEICLFEGSSRIGGRTYSHEVEGTPFTLDLGAYRFSPDMHLPGDLILNELELPTRCYEPSCTNAKLDMPPPFIFNYSAPLRRVVNPKSGLPSGYVTPIETMVERMKALGVVVAMRTELIALRKTDAEGAGIELTFRRNSMLTFSLTPRLLMLNLPRNRLFNLEGLNEAIAPRTADMLRCIKFDQPKAEFRNWSHLDHSSKSALSKAYIGYEDAWWITRLNLTNGEFPENAFFPVHTRAGIPVGIRWSDGPVQCESEGATRRCRGFLEAYYSVTNETFYYDLSGAPHDPKGELSATNPAHKDSLAKVHSALLEALSPMLSKAGISGASLPQPSRLVVGVWARPDAKYPLGDPSGLCAPTKVYYSPSISGPLERACGVPGLTESEYRRSALQPFGRERTAFMANNDWVAMDVRYMYGDWAEETLLQAERACRTLGMPRPNWLNQSYYEAKIAAFAPPGLEHSEPAFAAAA